MTPKRVGLITLGVVAATELTLVVTGARFLVSERRVNPGESYTVTGFGDLGRNGQGSLVCTFFNGRKLIREVFWYAPNGMLGKDACPTWHADH